MSCQSFISHKLRVNLYCVFLIKNIFKLSLNNFLNTFFQGEIPLSCTSVTGYNRVNRTCPDCLYPGTDCSSSHVEDASRGNELTLSKDLDEFTLTSGIVYSQNTSKLCQHSFYLLLPVTDVSIYLIIFI